MKLFAIIFVLCFAVACSQPVEPQVSLEEANEQLNVDDNAESLRLPRHFGGGFGRRRGFGGGGYPGGGYGGFPGGGGYGGYPGGGGGGFGSAHASASASAYGGGYGK